MSQPNTSPKEAKDVNQPEIDLPTKPAIIIKATRNGMEVEMQFQRTGTNTMDPLVEDIQTELDAQGITYGINKENLRHLCINPSYNKVFVIGRGLEPKQGADGNLNYLVKTSRELRPKINEDGTADFKDLGFIQNVLKEQPLCEIHPPKKGEDGMNVFGVVLDGKYGREVPAPAGLNTEVVVREADGVGVLRATCDGNVEVSRGIINVVDVLRINGSVDNSTGDIHFTGDVVISGDVISGFKVISGGAIVVRGSVEGAQLEAKYDITISEGMNGMGKGSLIAGGSVKCRYIQSSYIKAEENIYADTLMYCNIECGGNIELSGKRAALIGGQSSIAGYLDAGTIGTSTHVATEINMCATGMEKNQEALALEERIKQLDGEITKLVQITARYDELGKKINLNEEQRATIVKVKESYTQFLQQRKMNETRLKQVKQEQLEASVERSYITCKNRVHAGVRINFGPLLLNVMESFVYSRIHVVKGDISIVPL